MAIQKGWKTMNPADRVTAHFNESIANLQAAADTVTDAVARAAERISQSLLNGGKMLICGNGGSAADAQHFSSELLNRFEAERPGLPAVAITTDASTLTSIANDYEYADVFGRQIRALGQPGDVLFVITTSGNSQNILQALHAGHEKDMTCIALNGRDGGKAAQITSGEDINIIAPGNSTARIQEVHGLVIHCICDLIDWRIFGHGR
ncbi:MAG: phosphoheptose isomerase [Arenicellales bacterium]